MRPGGFLNPGMDNWFHVAMDWSMASNRARLFIDGLLRKTFELPEGRVKNFIFV